MRQVVEDVLNRMGRKINARVVKRWKTLRSIRGESYALDPTFTNAVKDEIVMQLSYGGQKAWIAEYGRGSLMDKSKRNKWAGRYRSSAGFNQARLKPLNAKAKKFSLVSRDPKTSYRDLDGNTYIASDKFPMAGFNLEYWAENYVNKPYRKHFLPMSPLYIIESEVKMALPEIEAELEKGIRSYIKGKLFGKAGVRHE